MNQIRKKKPLIHMITNDVTRESCVNMVLAAGGYAICAEAVEEVEDVVNQTDALLLNLGMPNANKAKAMKLALHRAKERGIPVVLDPVGVGVSDFRKTLAEELLAIGGITCIRGNRSEIACLCHQSIQARGVEATPVELQIPDMRALSEETGAMIMASGEQDILVWKSHGISKVGGGEVFCHLTGSGCMQSALLTAAIAAAENPWEGLQQGVALFDEAGAIAAERMGGMGSFAVELLDAMSDL